MHGKTEKIKYQLFNIIAYILLSTILGIQEKFDLLNSDFILHIYRLSAIDFNAWLNIARQCLPGNFISRFAVSKGSKHSQFSTDCHAENNVYRLIPFYLTFTAFVPLHAKFSITIYRIALRYRCLNNIIRSFTLAGPTNVCQIDDILIFHVSIIF